MSRAEDFRAVRKARETVKREHGIVCPYCEQERKGHKASILLPQETCRRHSYTDQRTQDSTTDYMLAVNRRQRKS